MNISSLVIQAKPEHVDALVAFFKTSDLCEYHLHDTQKGKIILTIEGKNSEEEMAKMKRIQAIPEVICADMMMAYAEDELEAQRTMLENESGVPSALNDETIAPEAMVYRGDLKKKID